MINPQAKNTDFDGGDFNVAYINNFIKMDPRPYNYEFRRPRPNNPTYQSFAAYDSLYHMGKKEYFNSNNILKEQYSSRLDLYSPRNSNPYQANYNEGYPQQDTYASRRYEETGVNTDKKQSSRGGSNYSQRSRSSSSSIANNPNPQTHRTSVLSTYGSNSLEKKQVSTGRRDEMPIYVPRNDTSNIFKKQQKPFNIINLYSRDVEPLRRFPKLTKEHLLYEQGMDMVGAQ